MNLSAICIPRPVLTIVMALLLVIFGAVGLTRLSVREFPDIDPPLVSVSTTYTGASPEIVESSVTEPLEDEITSIEGIKTLISGSGEGNSTITVEFELGRDINVAAQDVRDRVFRARGRLPDDVDEPIITKQDADAEPIIWLGLASQRYSQIQLTDYADRFLVDAFQTLNGVGRVMIGGERNVAMRIWLNPNQMAARRVTVLDVRDALKDEKHRAAFRAGRGQFSRIYHPHARRNGYTRGV